MIVVIHTDSRCVLTASSLTHMPSLSETLLVNFILSLDCAFSLIFKKYDVITLVNCQSTWFGV